MYQLTSISSSIAEKYQQEKRKYALSSNSRPHVEQTLEVHVRQTLFPALLNRN